jgi:hypothetical protein
MRQYPIDIANFFTATGLLVLTLVLVESNLGIWRAKIKERNHDREQQAHRDTREADQSRSS